LEDYEFVDPKTQKAHPFANILEPQSKYLSVVIPAYNEEARISVMLDETIDYLMGRQADDREFTWELVIVDDGSRDKTVEVVQEKYVKKFGTDLIRVNKLKKNVGKGGAVRRVSPDTRVLGLLIHETRRAAW
jgi:dolichyl-phosphate beta-glucosyltransferase